MPFNMRRSAASLLLVLSVAPAFAQSTSGVVISQVRVDGPNGGNDEFVELLNTGTAPAAIGGWTLQGCAATSGARSVRAAIPAGTMLGAGNYFLFTNSTAGAYSGGVAGDVTYGTGFANNTNAGIALVGSTSTTDAAVDSLGIGTGRCIEGTALARLTTTAPNYAFMRLVNGTRDTNDNASDFGPPGASNPHNSASPPLATEGGGTTPGASLSVTPAAFAEAGGSATVTATLSAAASADVTVNLAFSGSATNGTDYTPSASAIVIASGATTGTITLTAIDDTTFEGDESVVTTIVSASNATIGSPASATATITDDDPAPPPMIGPRIFRIQGAAHVSPMAGQSVSNVPGIVTVVDSNGFYMQDADGDGDVATSDGILVFTSTAPNVVAGQQVLVSGSVSEFRPNGATGLSVTEIDHPTVTPSSNLFTNTAIEPTIIGIGGRTPPTEIIDDDSHGNVETSPTTVFDPAQDGLDFYESLEGMLVQINDPVLTSPNLAGTAAGDRQYFVLGDNGTAATGRNARGGVTLVERAAGVDYNPERIELFTGLPDTNAPTGTVFNVGDHLAGPIVGVMSYFGNYEVLPIAAPAVARAANPVPTVTTIARGGDRLSIAAFNIENYDPNDPVARRNQLASEIVTNLGSPDIISLGEVQDNNGAMNDGTVAADVTLKTLIDAITAAGGPAYSYQQINPAAGNPDGGEPGGNIRVVQLYNPLRVSFVPGTSGAGDSTTATGAVLSGATLALTLSPGRADPTNTAWTASRKALAVTYDFNGRRVLVVGNHFNSKGGDQPLFGVNQPPTLSSETQRRQQAQIVHDFVRSALGLDANARVVVLGDLNDFDFSNPLRILRDGPLGAGGEEGTQPVLVNLGTRLVADPAERYSYVFDGNSQELDHILASLPLFNASSPQYQVAHVNSEYGNQASDHDPLVASFLLPANVAPDASATAAPATATSGATVTLDGRASRDSDGSIQTYRWVQTSGPAVTIRNADQPLASFVAPVVTATRTLTFSLTVGDDQGASTTATASVTASPAPPPVAPVANAGPDQSVGLQVQVVLNGRGSTPAPNGSINYAWVQTAGPAVALTAANTSNPTFFTGKPGRLKFQLTVRDPQSGATASDSVDVVAAVPHGGGSFGLMALAPGIAAISLRRRRRMAANAPVCVTSGRRRSPWFRRSS